MSPVFKLWRTIFPIAKMMTTDIREVSGTKMLRHFVYLPGKIHLNHKEWVPPVYMDDLDYFNSRKNTAFLHCDTILLLAYKGDKPVGRIMGIINREYNKTHNEQHARFSYLETENDYEVFSALTGAIENWARLHGMTNLVGPLAFSDKDPQGFLVEGFGQPVSIATNCNFPYMVDFTEQYGFQRKLDLVVYQIPIPDVLPPVVYKIRERYGQPVSLSD